MKLKSIQAINLKGNTFSFQLGAATAIVGDNFTGKTAIVEAIRLALMGYLPEVGKRAGSTWELSSGSKMEVMAEFDDGTAASRRFWLDGVTVKTSQECREPFGFFENLPLLHAESYFQMTDRERVDYVFSHVQLPESATPEAIVAEVERLSFEEAHTEQIQLVKQKLVRDVMEAFEAPDGIPWSGTVQDGLNEAIETFKERFSYWNKRAKDTQGAVTTMTELKLREQEITAASRDMDAEIGQLESELEQLMREHGALMEVLRESGRLANRKTVITNRINEARDARDAYPEAIERLREKIRLTPVITAGVLTRLEYDQASFTLIKAKAKLEGLQAQKRASASVIVKADEQLRNLATASHCPFCKSSGGGWKAHLEKELQEQIETASASNTQLISELEAIEASLFDLQRAIEASDEANRKNVQSKALIEGWEAQIKSLEREKASDESRLVHLLDELSEIEQQPTAENLDFQVAVLDKDITAKRSAKTAMAERKRAEVQLQQDLKRASQAQLEHLEAAANVTVIKAIAKLLNQKRADLVEEVFMKLLKVANQVCSGILLSPLAMHDGTIGRWSEQAKFIPHRVFSGTEKALCYIAIAVALSAEAPLRLVILDEFGRLDEEKQYKALLRLAILVADGVIDQFIVVGTSLPKAMENSNVHLEVIKMHP